MNTTSAIADKIIKDALGNTPLSTQQHAVCTWVTESILAGSLQNAVIEAVAGSGKTYTLKLVIKLIKHIQPDANIIYVVFAKKNQMEAAADIPASLATVATVHSVGFRTFKGANHKTNFKMEAKKVKLLIEEANVPNFLRSFVEDVVSYAKMRAFGAKGQPSLDNVAAYEGLIDHYGLEANLLEAKSELSLEELIELGINLSIKILKQSNLDSYAGTLDFDDQLYMPVLDKLCQAQKYDWVLIDEAQDTSTVRRELAAKLVAEKGRVIAVGDRHQAIYGFAGADNDSLDKIREKFECLELPLTVSFRCPKAVVNFAHQFGVTHIQAAESAPEGAVLTATDLDLLDATKWVLGPHDAAICRNTKPLVQLAYTMLAKNIACQILGKDIAAGLVKLVNKWSRVTTLRDLYNKLTEWVQIQVEKLQKAGKDAAAEIVQDQVDCLLFLIESMSANSTLQNLKDKINSMFVEANGASKEVFTLMTIHRSKGLEFDRVFWIGRTSFQPSKYARKDWQKQQEVNLCYVAATRAKKVLIDVKYIVKEDIKRRQELEA